MKILLNYSILLIMISLKKNSSNKLLNLELIYIGQLLYIYFIK